MTFKLTKAPAHRHLSTSTSTNSQLIEDIKTAKLDASLPHLLTADTQSSGRGQHGRTWQSPKGNVYLTLYLPMTQPITGLLSLVVGHELVCMPVIKQLNTHRAQHGMPTVGVKWVNDLGFYTPMAADGDEQLLCFHKLAGILIEPVWQAGALIGGVIGVGLNVRSAPSLSAHTLEGMSYQAISLGQMWQSCKMPPLPLEGLYEQITQALMRSYMRYQAIINSDQQRRHFASTFQSVDALLGHRLRVTRHFHDHTHTDTDDQTHARVHTEMLEGVGSGIDAQGCLLLRLDDARLVTLFTGRIDVMLM